MRTESDPNQTLARALALIDGIGAELSSSPFAHQTQTRALERIRAPTEAEADRRTSLALTWKADLAAVDRAVLPDEVALSLAVADATAERIAHEGPWFWHVHDPQSLGFFGLFGPTAYCGGWFLSTLIQVLGRQRLDTQGDSERYIGLVADVVDVVAAMRERLAGQRARGIVMPRPQILQARRLLDGMTNHLSNGLAPVGERLRHVLDSEGFVARVRRLVDTGVVPQLQGLRRDLGDDYAADASERVGMAQYEGGEAIYAALVQQHTTLNLDPDQVHQTGLSRIEEIRSFMAEIRGEANFRGDDVAYRAAIAADPRYRAADEAGVVEAFREKLTKVRPYLDRWLRFRPAAAFDVQPLPDALTGSMTFGVYQVSTSSQDVGRYLFNAPNLLQSGLSNLGALAFHELAPGHHIHLASQAENTDLPALRKHNSFNAFNEGWAEYAAKLAGEHGLYETREERFGRLMMDAFLTSRLVVDTGMNAKGWTLEQGRTYLRQNAFMAEHEVASESIRYACDMPGQSVAYKLGDTFLLSERERMRTALGDRFDLRDFHDAVLKPGALPLPLVSIQIDRAIARLNA